MVVVIEPQYYFPGFMVLVIDMQWKMVNVVFDKIKMGLIRGKLNDSIISTDPGPIFGNTT